MEWPLLDALEPEHRSRVVRALVRRDWRRGDTLFTEGQASDGLHLVATGHLAVSVGTADGSQTMLNVLGPGDFLGELSLVSSQPAHRSATVVALGDSSTYVISPGEFARLRASSPGTVELLLLLMARRINQLSRRLAHTMYDSLDSRVAGQLDQLAGHYAEAGRPAVVPFTQEQVAQLVGATRPSVNQVLRRLEDEGTVELGRGRIRVLDRERVARLAGG